MNCGTPGFLDLNWDRSMDPGAGDISLQTQFMASPLNSPPELHLSMMDHHHHQQHQQQQHQQQQHQLGDMAPIPRIAPFSADPGFVERAARFSRFGGGVGVGQDFGCLAGQSLRANRLQMNLLGPQLDVGGAEFGGNREDSSASDPVSESTARKRKAAPKGKGKDLVKDTAKLAEEESVGAKKSRSGDDTKGKKDEIKPKIEQNGGASSSGDDEKKQVKGSNAKLPEPPKDYIHVRARRGQATDSHSLAERVRREKISERMKLLQDLVPGCNKVTGKALMLDEIINYVQSLQRQVEFLSMKLATVNPRLDVNMENLLQKDMHQTNGPLPNSTYPFEASSGSFPYAHQPQQGTPLQCMVTNGLETQVSMNSLDPTLHRILSMQLPNLDGFRDAASQLGNFWEDDLQNVVQMGFGQSQEMALSSQSFHDSLPAGHMKLDL